MKKLFLTIALLISVLCVMAQHPLTAINFYKTYLDNPIVKKASMANGVISEDMMDYILKKSNPAEIKYAIVNALGYKGKAAKQSRNNETTLYNYFTQNYDMTMDYADLLKTFGVTTTMAVIYYIAISDTSDLSYNLEAISAISDANSNYGNHSRVTEIISSLIKAQNAINSIPDFGEFEEGEHIPVQYMVDYQNEQSLWQAKATHLVKHECLYNENHYANDMKQPAIDIIWNYMKQYDEKMSIIKIVSKSYNPYQLKINGIDIKLMDGHEEFEYLCQPGYYHIEAVQQSGFVFSPTINRKDVNIVEDETIIIEIGY